MCMLTGIHGSTARHDNVGVQVLPDVNIALHDAVVGRLVEPRCLHTDEGWLEEGLRASESLVVYTDHLSEIIEGLLEFARLDCVKWIP